jgi:dCTP deaminase
MGALVVEMADPAVAIQPASIDLHVREGMKMLKGDFRLASVMEYIELPPYLVGEVKGVSTVGRRGLIPQTAGYVDPGFRGYLTLELVYFGEDPLIVEAGQRIAQLVLYHVVSAADPPYAGRYQDQPARPVEAIWDQPTP